MIWTKQKAFCRACGKEMQTDFRVWGGEVCNTNCFKELEWRKILAMMGKDYYPDPKAGTYLTEVEKNPQPSFEELMKDPNYRRQMEDEQKEWDDLMANVSKKGQDGQ